MITQERIRELLNYDADTGEFTWLTRPEISHHVKTWNARYAGKTAGRLNDHNGYREISIDDRRYKSHRLAWLWVHGDWPRDCIDHIDGNKLNNAIANLREATKSENGQNSGKHRDNTSGWKGVSWYGARRKWCAEIMVSRRRIRLGYYDCPDAAAAAYAIAANKYHGEFANTGDLK